MEWYRIRWHEMRMVLRGGGRMVLKLRLGEPQQLTDQRGTDLPPDDGQMMCSAARCSGTQRDAAGRSAMQRDAARWYAMMAGQKMWRTSNLPLKVIEGGHDHLLKDTGWRQGWG